MDLRESREDLLAIIAAEIGSRIRHSSTFKRLYKSYDNGISSHKSMRGCRCRRRSDFLSSSDSMWKEIARSLLGFSVGGEWKLIKALIPPFMCDLFRWSRLVRKEAWEFLNPPCSASLLEKFCVRQLVDVSLATNEATSLIFVVLISPKF